MEELKKILDFVNKGENHRCEISSIIERIKGERDFYIQADGTMQRKLSSKEAELLIPVLVEIENQRELKFKAEKDILNSLENTILLIQKKGGQEWLKIASQQA